MNLATTYLGFDLPHPLVPGASPMSDSLDTVKKLEDAGAPAIVMHSLFEEQIVAEQMADQEYTEVPAESFAEAVTYFPNMNDYPLGCSQYLDHIRKIKAAVAVPVIASLNGVSVGGWLDYASQIEQAGADAIELNLYVMVTDPDRDAAALEQSLLDVVKTVRDAIKIPVAVKLSPFYSSLPNFAAELAQAGADGLVLFNRFYQPDIDVDALDVSRTLELSRSAELRLRLRWLAILSGQLGNVSLAAGGGVHSGVDAVKAVMAGADVVQVVSALLQNGPEYLKVLREGLATWMEQHQYESLDQMKDSMNLSKCPQPAAYERANYVHILQHGRDTLGD